MMKTDHNPSMGRIWIYSDELKLSKKWDKNLSIPDGWKQGRVIDWTNKEQKRIKQDDIRKRRIKKWEQCIRNRKRKEE